jgi:hypothetical protein
MEEEKARVPKNKKLTLYTGNRPVGEVWKTKKGRKRLCYKVVLAKMTTVCPIDLRDKEYKYVNRKKEKTQ